MVVVNIYGVPGSGKSTAAAYLFYKFKEAGVNAELITEFTKDLIWEDNYKAISNQFYVAGNQLYRLTRIKDKVDVVVTDSPMLLQPVYYKYNGGTMPDVFELLIHEIDKEFQNINYVLPIPTEIESAGRIHDINDAINIYKLIADTFERYDVPYKEINRKTEEYDKIFENVKGLINPVKEDKL